MKPLMISLILICFSSVSNAALIQLGGSNSGTGNFWPFSADGSGPFGSGNGARYQTGYDTSLFSGISGPIQINAISFIAGNQFAFPTSYSNSSISLALSSSPNDVGSLSTNFDSNVGTDATTVFDDSISFSASGLGDLVTFNLSTSFVFNPTLGFDLLLDILPKGTATGRFSGETGGIRRIYSSSSSSGIGNDLAGLAIVLDYSDVTSNEPPKSVSEPSALALLGLGLIGMTIRRKRLLK